MIPPSRLTKLDKIGSGGFKEYVSLQLLECCLHSNYGTAVCLLAN